MYVGLFQSSSRYLYMNHNGDLMYINVINLQRNSLGMIGTILPSMILDIGNCYPKEYFCIDNPSGLPMLYRDSEISLGDNISQCTKTDQVTFYQCITKSNKVTLSLYYKTQVIQNLSTYRETLVIVTQLCNYLRFII